MNAKRVKTGFTIIELLTVMSIIIVLISILVPALNRVRKVAKDLQQKSQFYDIEKALAEFRTDHDDEYPNSDGNDTSGVRYCGAMKLCEALVGQDGMGFHTESRFWAGGGTDSDGNPLYPYNVCQRIRPGDGMYGPEHTATLRKRQLYLENRSIKTTRLDAMYQRSIAPFVEGNRWVPNAVICDVYLRASVDAMSCTAMAGEKVGMPVLYYRADPRKTLHDANFIDLSTYNSSDNQDLINLGLPWENPAVTVPAMAARPQLFYEVITNPAVTSTPTPFKKDEFILISAGWDGEFGTRDDVFNFRR